MNTRPERTEAAEYYFKYIDQVVAGDIRELLEAQGAEVLTLLGQISEEKSLDRYAPGKWSIRDVVNHLNDTERLFTFRAFWFARGFESPLPSFDEAPAAVAANADSRTWGSLLDELAAARAATTTFYRSLSPDSWARRGTASGNPFTVRALAYLTAGHMTHHVKILHERYLSA